MKGPTIQKRIGLRTEPCGTPKKTSTDPELWPLTVSLSPTSEVRLTPRKSSARNATERLKSVEENMVVDSIESRG